MSLILVKVVIHKHYRAGNLREYRWGHIHLCRFLFKKLENKKRMCRNDSAWYLKNCLIPVTKPGFLSFRLRHPGLV